MPGRPATNDAVNRAVDMVAEGANPRAAWNACGRPNGEAAIQNIGQRGRTLKRKRQEPPAPEPVAEPAAAPAAAPAARKKQRKVYNNARQTEQHNKRKREVKDERNVIHKQAQREVAKARSDGVLGQLGSRYSDIAERATALLPEGAKPITRDSLQKAGDRYAPGTTPKKTGPASKLPKELFEGATSFVQLKQVDGQEQRGRESMQAMLAAVKGTALEEALNSKPKQDRAKRKLRGFSDVLSTQTSVPVNERRHQWLTASNLKTWFNGGLSGGYEACLEKHGFLEPRADGEAGPRDIPMAKRRRMLNMDETHHYMGTGGDKGGSRANVLVDKRLGRCGRRKVENPSHITGMHWANYAGEVGSGMYLFSSAANEEEARRIKLSWIDGLPHARGIFGFGEIRSVPPSAAVTPNGGTVAGTFQQFVETQIYPAYPDLWPSWETEEVMTGDGPELRIIRGPVFMQVDSGPDRVNESNLNFRIDAAQRGLIIFPGLPNGTAANQLMDGVFGPFKIASNLVCEQIVAERIEANQEDSSISVKLTTDDLPRVINGRSEEELLMLELDLSKEVRPFTQSFGPRAFASVLEKLGLCPVHCETALKHPRVRDDTNESSRAELISSIQTRHASSLAALAKAGLKSTAMAVKPKSKATPSAAVTDVANVAPRSSLQQAWTETVKSGASAGKNWVTVGAMAYTDEFLTSAELERVDAARQAADQKTIQMYVGFLDLQEQARTIESTRISTGKGYGDLSAADAAVLVRYEFKARSGKNVSKVSGKAACVAHLDGLADGALASALESPLLLKDVDTSEARLMLAAPAAGFGDVGVSLPDGLVPISAPPPWLEHALDPTRPESGQLSGRSILFNWGDNDGGWAIGVLGEPNTSKKYRANGVQANFRAKYAADGSTVSHVLSLTNYAADASAEEEAWVLLGPQEVAPLLLTDAADPMPASALPAAGEASSRLRGKQRAQLPMAALPVATPTPSLPAGLDPAVIASLSPADIASLMMTLRAQMSAGSSSADARRL